MVRAGARASPGGDTPGVRPARPPSPWLTGRAARRRVTAPRTGARTIAPATRGPNPPAKRTAPAAAAAIRREPTRSRWGASRAVRQPKVSTTWRGTSGSGSPTATLGTTVAWGSRDRERYLLARQRALAEPMALPREHDAGLGSRPPRWGLLLRQRRGDALRPPTAEPAPPPSPPTRWASVVRGRRHPERGPSGFVRGDLAVEAGWRSDWRISTWRRVIRADLR